MHGKSARTGAAHARAARASEGHGRALLPCAVLLALVALLIAPVRAYADANYRTVLWSGDEAGGKQYIVGADNKYDAAAYICGQTSAQVAAYDLTVRYKLSATENDFAALADSLEKDWPGWNEDTLAQSLAETFNRDVNGKTLWQEMTSGFVTSGTAVGIKPFGTYLDIFQVDYWQRNVDCDIYAVDTTSDAVSRARDDLEEILNGGGGGGTVATDTFDVYMMYGFYSNAISGQTNYGYRNFTINGEDYTTRMTSDGSAYYNAKLIQTPFHVHVSNLELPTLPEGYGPEDVALFLDNGSSGTLRLLDENNLTLNEYSTTSKSGYEKQFKMYDGTCTTSYSLVIRFDTLTANENGINVSAYTYPQGASWVHFANPSMINIKFPTTTTAIGFNSTQDQPDPDPPSGPGNWPDPPSNPTPEPPTVPDPPQNPEPDPPSTPVAPTPPPLEPPTNVTIPTGTTSADYTPWLRAILEQLQTLTNELASHCVHLQEEMQTSVNELQDTLIYRFNSLEEYLKELFDALEYYLCDMAKWLAEQLNFNVNVDPYDDSSVLYWLRQIYSRLGNLPKSPTTVMDPDPTEPFDFWAWLMNLIANTVGGIIGDLVGDVAGLLDLFKDKFPFSIPWDIAALLTLLDGTRATPAFDVKLAAVPGWWEETTFRIDLSPFDSVASACRTMVNILWVMVLVMKTDWMLAIMGDATSFGERFARKVARTS